MNFKFPSIANVNLYEYAYNTIGYYDDRAIQSEFVYRKIINEKLSCTMNVVPVELLGDYLASLALAMLADNELSKEVYWRFSSTISENDIEFAASIIWKEGKRRYYSTELRKISSVQTKQYDRRFEPITSEMDGSPKAIFDLLITDNGGSGLYKYGVANDIRNWLWKRNSKKTKRKNVYMDQPAEFLGWTTDNTLIHCIRNGYEACKFAVAAHTARQNVESSISCFKNFAIQSKLEQ
jgi:hypothetical protein